MIYTRKSIAMATMSVDAQTLTHSTYTLTHSHTHTHSHDNNNELNQSFFFNQKLFVCLFFSADLAKLNVLMPGMRMVWNADAIDTEGRVPLPIPKARLTACRISSLPHDPASTPSIDWEPGAGGREGVGE